MSFTGRPALGHDVEADGRLVEVDDLRVVQQRHGEVRTHLLAERELAHGRPEELLHLQQLDEEPHVPAKARVVDAVHLLVQPEGLLHGEVPVQRGALAEDHPHPQGVGDAVAVRHQAADLYRARGRHEDAGEHLHRRGLAGAVGPDVADQLSALDTEACAVHGPPGLELGRQKRRDPPDDALGPRSHPELLGQLADLDVRHAFPFRSRCSCSARCRGPRTRMRQRRAPPLPGGRGTAARGGRSRRRSSRGSTARGRS